MGLGRFASDPGPSPGHTPVQDEIACAAQFSALYSDDNADNRTKEANHGY
jgi:hypothetical protein